MYDTAKKIIGKMPVLASFLKRWRDNKAVNSLSWHPVADFGFEILGGNWFAAGNYAGIGGGVHELQELVLMGEALASVDLLIDVGANSGMFSLLAAAKGKRAIAFEPMQQNLAILLKNVRHNKAEQMIEIVPLGVSDSVGIAPFFGSGQVASLVAGWGGQLEAEPILVPLTTLDTLLADRLAQSRFAIKIDVEGAELAVLRGASRLLDRHPPLLIENSLTANHPDGFNPSFAAVFELLWNRGYAGFVADAARTPVTRAMLDGWIAVGRADVETENFYFERA